MIEMLYLFLLGLALITLAVTRFPSRLDPICNAWLAAFFGAQQNLAFKAVGMLVYSSSVVVDESSRLNQPVTYIFSGILLICAFLQLVCLNTGLAQHDAVLFLPLYSGLLILSSTILGGEFFKEFECFSKIDRIVFPLGILIVGWGMILLTRRSDRNTGR